MAKRKMDGGEKAFCRGIEQTGDMIAPGLGAFIRQCVKDSMERHGLEFQDPDVKVKSLKHPKP